MADLSGQSIGRYYLLEPIGQGGMAVVYRAYDTRLEREVAIKLIRMEAFPAEAHERVLHRFDREGRALARLSHPNIVKVHDYGEHAGAPYLVMELLEGGTLKDRTGTALPWQEAVQLLKPVADALGYAHAQGILHRDVKPSNILITMDGQIVLNDFGIAKLLEGGGEEKTLTGTGLGVGTPEYMAPEQGLGGAVDERADVYALGVVLFELVTGRKPYTAETPMAVILKQVHDPLPRPMDLVEGLPREVEQVLLKALAKQPADRFPNMAAFADALVWLADGGFSTGDPAYKSFSGTGGRKHKRSGLSNNSPAKRTRKSGWTSAGLGSGVSSFERDSTSDHLEIHDPDYIARSQQLPERGGGRRVWITAGIVGVVVLGIAVLMRGVSSEGWFQPDESVNPGTDLSTLSEDHQEVILGEADLTESSRASATPWSSEMATTPLPETISTPEHAAGSTRIREPDGMVEVYVPSGNFLMGAAEFQHEVYLDGYWIDQTEVTNGMYEDCVTGGACSPPQESYSLYRAEYYGDAAYSTYPVVFVDWDQASAYCAYAGARLPTEAEWEKAARGTDGRSYPWGSEEPEEEVQIPNSADTLAAGSYPAGASPYGVLDMAANVYEWVADWYDADYYRHSPGNNPTGPESGQYRVLRSETNFNISSYDAPVFTFGRSFYASGYPRLYFVGFRCARSE